MVHCLSYLASSIFSRNKKSKLNLLSAFSIGVIITTLANTIFLYRLEIYGVSFESMYHYVLPKHTLNAAVLWSIGNSFIYIGYEFFSRKSFPSLRVEINSDKVLDTIFWVVFGLFVLNFTGNLVRLNFISGGLQKTLILFNDMSVLFFARLWGKEGKNKYRNYAITLCVFRVTIAVISAYLRIELVQPFIVFFGGYFLGKGSIKYLFSYRVLPMIGIFLFFATIFGTLGANRAHFSEVFKGKEKDVSKVEVAPSYAISSAAASDRNNVLVRGANMAQLSNIFGLVERRGFYNGKVTIPLLYAFIPRFLWPGKPIVELGAWYALEIGVATISVTGRANNSINMSIPGQLYLDFGYLGVILGCFFFGGIVAMFWNAAEFDSSPYNLIGSLWGGYLLFFALFGIGADMQILITFTSTYLSFFLIKKIIGLYYAHSERRTALEGQ